MAPLILWMPIRTEDKGERINTFRQYLLTEKTGQLIFLAA